MEIKALIEQLFSNWTPVKPVQCLRCRSTYERLYCVELSAEVFICKGCNEAPLFGK